MPQTKNLRYYQRAAIDALYDYFERQTGNPLISMATGTGKALVLCALCKEAIDRWPETNMVVLTSVKELVEQNYLELLGIWPEAPASLYSAGLGVKNLSGKIIFAGIQSIYKNAYKIPRRIDLIIIDECQYLSENDGTMYRTFIDAIKLCNPAVKVIGLSATIFRLSQGLLTDGDNAIFTDVVYDYGMLQGIKDEFLSPIVSKGMSQQFDLTGVGVRGGEYIQGQLAAAVDQADITKKAIDEVMQYGADRRCWLIFATSIDHAIHIRDEVRSRGVTCEVVHSKMPKGERDDIIARYKAGHIRCIANINIMTTGTNVPQIDLIVAMRPSKSAGLIVQAAGRGTRLSPATSKQDCLLLDFAGWLRDHGPIDLIRPKRKGKKGEGVAPVKTCPMCSTIIHAGLAHCSECGHEFEYEQKQMDSTASDEAALSIHMKQTKEYEVSSVSYYRHKKEGARDSLRVEYLCGMTKVFNRWICLEHSGGAREMACYWWRQTAGTTPPNTIADALSRVSELKKPRMIKVKKNGKYHEVIGMEM